VVPESLFGSAEEHVPHLRCGYIASQHIVYQQIISFLQNCVIRVPARVRAQNGEYKRRMPVKYFDKTAFSDCMSRMTDIKLHYHRNIFTLLPFYF
jgi:hypothetical protein